MGAEIEYSTASRPFLVAAVVSVFAGSIVGSAWLMSLLGARLPFEYAFPLHRVLQMNGFLTLLVMGVGYMIVPRFRNAGLPSKGPVYLSLALTVASLAGSVVYSLTGYTGVEAAGHVLRVLGTLVFAAMTLRLLRTPPRLLRLADYFIGLSVVTLVTVNVLDDIAPASDPLSVVQLWILFPMLMIFGIEYKTLPSFLGFIRPKKRLAQTSFVLAAAALGLGVLSSALPPHALPLSLAFNVSLFASASLLVASLFIYGGFDYGEITSLLSGERKARYSYTLSYSRIAYGFLFLSMGFAVLFHTVGGSYGFLFYDLAIHTGAIGFLGITIALYLPLMLPPILGRQVQFVKFNHAPLVLLCVSLGLRAAADLTAGRAGAVSYVLMASGWLVVAALAVFVLMLHRSMSER